LDPAAGARRDLSLVDGESPSAMKETIASQPVPGPALEPAARAELFDGVLKGLAWFYRDDALEAERRALAGSALEAGAHASAAEAALGRFAARAPSPFARRLAEECAARPRLELENFINRGQMASKRWLLDELHAAVGAELGTVFVLGGWFGALSALILEDPRFRAERIVSFDIDPDATATAERLNRHYVANEERFRAATADLRELDLRETVYRVAGPAGLEERRAKPGLVINTSCEHFERFGEWFASIPAGVTLVLQSNDYYSEPTHVNCVPDLEAFARQAPMSRVLRRGTLATKKYNRFMLIGVK